MAQLLFGVRRQKWGRAVREVGLDALGGSNGAPSV
jgi:hypothetical protein